MRPISIWTKVQRSQYCVYGTQWNVMFKCADDDDESGV